jgi:site-specific DNA-methyltransferase (adenine-specific)
MFVDIKKIKPHPKNQEIYSLSNIDDLRTSIRSVGLLEKIIIDQHFQIISGHRRYLAVCNLNWKEVECEQIEVNESDAITYLIHHNKQRIKTCRELLNEAKVLMEEHKIGQGKRSDLILCEEVLTSVNLNRSRTRDIVGDLIGISGVQITKLLFIEKHNPGLIDLIDNGLFTINQAYIQTSRDKKEQDAQLENRKTSKKTFNDNFRFFKKCSSKMNELSTDEVDCIFTSPPYWNKRKYCENGGLGNEKDSDEYVSNLVKHLNDCKRVLSDTGSFFLNLGDTFHQGNLMNIPHRVAISLQEKGWILRNTIIWAKTNPKPSSSKNNLCPTYEFIFHLVKSMDYKYNHTLIPLKEDTKPSHAPRHRNLKCSSTMQTPYIPREGKNMGDWWNEDIVKSAVVNQKSFGEVEHPAPFPPKIVTLPVLQTTQEGDLVLDPFMGSGTTGNVANQYNRRFVGYDVQVY